jgi:hypothetical protein
MATARHASAKAKERNLVAGGSGPSETCRPESGSMARTSPLVMRTYRRSNPADISSIVPHNSATGSRLSSQLFARHICVPVVDAM